MAERSAPPQPDLRVVKPGPRLVTTTPARPPSRSLPSAPIRSSVLAGERMDQGQSAGQENTAPPTEFLDRVKLLPPAEAKIATIAHYEPNSTTALQKIVDAVASQPEPHGVNDREPTKVIPITSKAKQPHLPEVRHHFAAGSTDIPRPADNGAGKPEGTPVPKLSKREAARESLRKDMEKKGFILPPEHEFSQLIEGISKRLSIPQSTEFILLDNEDFDAFLRIDADTIVVSRGTFRKLLDNKLTLSEDHIAALLAHEIEHAELQLKYPPEEKGVSSLAHAEEYRADAEAMTRLSKAGYNPRAVIELFRSFPLILGRHDPSHPEVIDRVRKLEDRLADDKHPLAHTSKEKTPLNAEMITWIQENSEFYNRTEGLLGKPPEELEQILLQTTTQQEFWDTLEIKDHTERVAAAKTLIEQQKEVVDRFVAKMMIFASFRKLAISVNGEIINPQHYYGKVIEYGNIPEERRKIDTIAGAFHAETILSSRAFREIIQPSGRIEYTEEASVKMQQLEQYLDKYLEDRLFSQATLDELPPSEKKAIEKYRGLYKAGQVDTDVFLTLFPKTDIHVQQRARQRELEESKKRGVRASDETKKDAVDFNDSAERQDFYEQVRLGLAMKLVDISKIPPDNISDHYADILQQETGLHPDAAAVVAHAITHRDTINNWAVLLSAKDKTELSRILAAIQRVIPDDPQIPISPLRSLHQAFVSSNKTEPEREKYYAHGNEFDVADYGINALMMLPAKQLYLKGYPPGYQLTETNHLPPTDINLALDEWDALVKAESKTLDYRMKDARNMVVLKTFLNRTRAGEPVDEALRKRLQDIDYITPDFPLTLEEMQIIFQHNPWPQKKANEIFDGLITQITSPREHIRYDPTSAVDTLSIAYDWYKKLPDQQKLEISEGYTYSADTLATHMLRLKTQMSEARGVPTNQALVESIKYLTEKGISLPYGGSLKDTPLRPNEEVVSRFSSLTQADYQELIAYFENHPQLDKQQLQMLETFRLLNDVIGQRLPLKYKFAALEARDINPLHVPTEKILEALIAKHGESTIQWVLQNFSPSGRRDILLADIINRTSGKTKTKFIAEIEAQFTTSPDEQNGRTSPNFDYLNAHYFTLEYSPYYQVHKTQQGKRYYDLLTRRHDFSLSARRIDRVVHNPYDSHWGSVQQKVQADRLVVAERTLFNPAIPLEARAAHLREVAPQESVVRDIHLEMLLSDALVATTADQEKIAAGNLLLPLFTKDSSLKTHLATEVLRAELRNKPEN